MLIEGGAFPRDRKVAVVAARFNDGVTSRLLGGALARLRERGVPEEAVDVARVPGAFELPGAAKRLALTGRYAAIICLGAVIRGETPHFDYICQACAHGIAEVGLTTGVPVLFGVLTCDTVEQAMARAGKKPEGEAPGGHVAGHKGIEAVDAALELAGLYAAIGPVKAPAES